MTLYGVAYWINTCREKVLIYYYLFLHVLNKKWTTTFNCSPKKNTLLHLLLPTLNSSFVVLFYSLDNLKRNMRIWLKIITPQKVHQTVFPAKKRQEIGGTFIRKGVYPNMSSMISCLNLPICFSRRWQRKLKGRQKTMNWARPLKMGDLVKK